jgi:hypothetical protein
MKLQAKNVTGGMLLTGILVLGIVNVAGSGTQTVDAQASDGAQKTFSTPEQAGQALRAAAGAANETALTEILGPDSKAIVFSGDTEEDRATMAGFVLKYDRMNRWVTMRDGSKFLYIGPDNYPYPIPLAQNSSSQWYFNTAAGKDEILARRIGENELLAIDAVSAMANAEDLYRKTKKQYTEKILSTPGSQDGLYWQVPTDQPSSPLGRVDEFAKNVVTSTPPSTAPIFDGYSFRIITGDAGYTVVATPVTYGDSGIMTFVLSKGGEFRQKDLGPNSAAISNYNANDGWTPAE